MAKIVRTNPLGTTFAILCQQADNEYARSLARLHGNATVYLTPEVELAGYEISCGHVGCETVHARDENKMSLFPCSPIYCRKQYLFSSC